MAAACKLLLTTVPGLEDVALEEVKELLTVVSYTLRPYGLKGRLIVTCKESAEEAVDRLCLKARSIERVFVILASDLLREGDLVDSLKYLFKKVPKEAITSPYLTFAVRAEREGAHKFTSLDVARLSGECLQEAVEEEVGLKPLISLDNPFIELLVDVAGENITVGINASGLRGLHDREYRVYYHPASLNPIIAHAMARLAKVKGVKSLLDPMCGSGTLAIEAALYGEVKEIYCMDINPMHLEGAKENLKRAGLIDRAKLILGDALKLEEHFKPGEIDRVLVNPPYGIRVKGSLEPKELYRSLLRSIGRIASKDCIVGLLTPRRKLFKGLALKEGFEIIHERRVEHGGLTNYVFIFKKKVNP